MGFLAYMTGFGVRDMAVDLGTTNTLIYVQGRGVVLSEPSVVAVDSRTGGVYAVGTKAKQLLDRTSGSITTIRPLKDGVIADFAVTEEMLRHFIRKVDRNRWARPRVVVCVPNGVTDFEKRAVEEVCLSAGAQQAHIVEEPMAAAIGAGLPVSEPIGSMILDVGGGTSEIAVISLGEIVASRSIRVAGDEFDTAIVNYIKRKYKLLIGQQTAEKLKVEIGSAYPMSNELQTELRARGLVTEPPQTVLLSSAEVRDALEEPVSRIMGAIRETMDHTPPELASDVMDRGIVLAGGGALLRGLDERLRHDMHMPAHLAESPLACVAFGSGKLLEKLDETHRRRWMKRVPRRKSDRVSRHAGNGEVALANVHDAVGVGGEVSMLSPASQPSRDEQEEARLSDARAHLHPPGAPGRNRPPGQHATPLELAAVREGSVSEPGAGC